jgi:hypothetical protein
MGYAPTNLVFKLYLHFPCPHALLKVPHKLFLFALLLFLACCSGRTQISLGGTPTNVMVQLLSPIDFAATILICND